MFAPTIVRKGQLHFEWLPRKAMRAVMMMGVLLFASIVVNALIILATASKV